MKRGKVSATALLSSFGVLALFFAILIYGALEVLRLQQHNNFLIGCVFFVIGGLIFSISIVGGFALPMKLPFKVSIFTSSVFYMAAECVLIGYGLIRLSGPVFVLLNLTLLLVYFVIVIPMTLRK